MKTIKSIIQGTGYQLDNQYKRVYSAEDVEKCMQKYAIYMCEEQKEIDFKHAKLKQIDSLHMCPQYVVDKDSILNAPLATDKNK